MCAAHLREELELLLLIELDADHPGTAHLRISRQQLKISAEILQR